MTPDPRIATARDLARRGDPRARDLLLAALPDAKLATAELLGRIGAPWTLAPLTSLLSDPDPGLRSEAILALARTNQPLAIPPLLDSLSDPDPSRREDARIGLVRLLGPSIAPELSLDTDDPDEPSRARAWWAARAPHFPPDVALFAGAPLDIAHDIALLSTASPAILPQLIDEIENWVGADIPAGSAESQAAFLRSWWPAHHARFAIGRRYYFGHPV